MIKRKIRSNNLRDKKRLAIVVKRIKRRRKSMGRIVSTSTLFQTTKDYNSLTEQEQSEYIRTLSKEFLKNADDLMLSLKDK